jgi:hypothetical protein
VFGYKEKGSISPGSSLGSVIGYPSITVPMGFVEEFSYGVEFFTQAYKEETIYNVAAVFEKVNGNSINNSKLTPSLYEVPSEVTKLVNLYDSVVENESDSTIVKEWLVDTKDFLINYNDYDNEKIVAMDLIEKYEASVAKYLSNGKIKCFQYITIFMMIISFLIIYSELKRCFK